MKVRFEASDMTCPTHPGGSSRLFFLRQGCTALVIAAQYGFVELVIYLSNHGCDPAAIDSVGDSALHWAAYKGPGLSGGGGGAALILSVCMYACSL